MSGPGRRGPGTAALMRRSRTARSCLLAILALLVALVGSTGPLSALTPIVVQEADERLEITSQGQVYEGRGDNLQIETAADASGATFRMSVRATTAGTNPGWIVFAIRNQTTKPIERWLTADRYTTIGSGIIWPDLDARRIEKVTQSEGLEPERIRNDRADVFRVNIDPGRTVTFVAELSSDRLPRLQLWKPLSFEQKHRDRQLFHGILLGITGLLAIFLTAVFAANHKLIFPSSALVAWCVLALLCVDFGFWHRLFPMRPEDNAQYRAVAEAAVAASLVIFLFSFLRGSLWHGFLRMLFLLWIAAQIAVVATAALDPRLAATIARMSLGGIGLIGALMILAFSLRRLDRALALAPTWILLLVWLFAAGVTITGRLTAEIAVSGLVSGLVLITLLLGFTVTQFAFRASEPMLGGSASDQQLRAAAVESSGAGVWEWSLRRDELKIDPVIEMALGLNEGDLSGRLDEFLSHLHQGDRERFQLMMQAVKERSGGPIKTEFRIRHADSSYRWLELEGAAMPTSDHRSLRCVGLVRDVTDQRRAHDRLLHDAVHDSLTGLPNRELFLDRLMVALARGATVPVNRATVLFLDLDKFKSVNSSFGLVVGDSLLLTVARRLAHSLGPTDTLARIGGDQFAMLILGEQDPRDLAMLAERVRRALRSPIKIAGQDIVLTGSIGIAVSDATTQSGAALLGEAETAMYRAKRAGSDRIEIFTPQMHAARDERISIESDLRRAIEQGQLQILYQPIIRLSTESLVGFEALVRWDHPKHGQLSPAEFIPVAEETDLVVRLGSYVLARALDDAQRWQSELDRPDQPLYVSVNVSSRQLLKPDLVPEIRQLIGRSVVARGTLRLEITESLVMENPERATHVLTLLREAGVDLALDDFGAGYSSLAYLQRFPFDTIKIDRAIVQGGTDTEAGGAIVRSIVALSHELGKKVVAEGVETAEDAAFLRALGCEFAQGFYYGAAVPQREALNLVRMLTKSEKRMRRRGLVIGGADRPASADEPRSKVEIGKETAPAAARAAAEVSGNAQTSQHSGPNGPPPASPRTQPPSPPPMPHGRQDVAQPATVMSPNGAPAPGPLPPPITRQPPAPAQANAPEVPQFGQPGPGRVPASGRETSPVSQVHPQAPPRLPAGPPPIVEPPRASAAAPPPMPAAPGAGGGPRSATAQPPATGAKPPPPPPPTAQEPPRVPSPPPPTSIVGIPQSGVAAHGAVSTGAPANAPGRVPPSGPSPRRPARTTLSPAMAASLARLAGTFEAGPAGSSDTDAIKDGAADGLPVRAIEPKKAG